MSEWWAATLGDVLTLQRGFDLPTKDRQPGSIPVVASNGITGTHCEARVEPPGVVIGRSGFIGGAQFLGTAFWPLNTTLWVKDFKGNNPRFCYFLLKSLNFSRFNAGSGVPTLNRNHIHPLPVSVPTAVAEQKTIGEMLGALDDKIELNRRMAETLEQMARALFKSWFIDFDPVKAKAEGRKPEWMDENLADMFPNNISKNGIPETWKKVSLLDVSEKPQYGYTASAKPSGNGVPFLRIADINKSPWIEWETVPDCDIDSHDHEKYMLHDGDFVIARMADPGHAALISAPPDGAVFASYLIRFRPLTPSQGFYLKYWSKSSAYWSLVNGHKSGSTRHNLNATVLGQFPLLKPSEDILNKYQEIVEPQTKTIDNLVRQNAKLAQLRDALLPKLLSGEIRVKDAEKIAEDNL